MQNEKCYTCQCSVTRDDVEDQLGPNTVPPDGIIGTIPGSGEQVQISGNDTTYLEANVTIDVGPCTECMCLPNYTFVCTKRDPCFTTTTVPTTTPFCRGSWSEWSPCPYGVQCETAMTKRNRTCNTLEPACNCTSEIQTEYQECLCVTTTTVTTTTTSTTLPTSEKVCLVNCFNECEDTCQHHGKTDCVVTTSSGKCRCKECPDGQLKDNFGNCFSVEKCPCYTPSGEEVPIGHGRNYTENCTSCYCNQNRTWVCKPIKDCCVSPPTLFPWGPCSTECGNGTRSRYRFDCSGYTTETEPCFTPTPQKDCYNCICLNGTVECTPKPEYGNATWMTWAEWSLCVGEKNCKDYTRTRCRTCQRPKCGPSISCVGPEVEVEPCNSKPCCGVFKWSEWNECSSTCGGGYRSRTKIFIDAATTTACADTDITDTEECGNCDCAITTVNNWLPWTACTTTAAVQCGWGSRSRTRTVIPKCEGVPDVQMEDCFISPCDCETGYMYSNHSKCAPTCQKPQPDPSCSLDVDPKCVCAKNMYMDMTTQKCVPIEKCYQCVYKNVTYQPGDRWECGECDYCSCCAGNTVPERKKCANVTECDLTTHQLVPSEDKCCPVDCVPKTCQLKTSDYKVIERHGCVSTETYPVQTCEGPCPNSKLSVDYANGVMVNECMCCAALLANVTTVMLHCPDGTSIEHSVPILASCKCNLTLCP